jgi:glycosyltransferase involved in cell wall biosynthesis
MISVIITAYNYDKYIERAIRSSIDQSIDRKSYEIIIINDASTDKTSTILENYKDDLRIYNLEKNIGLSAARNFGIKKAKGQFVVFLDADDYLQKDILKIQHVFLTENNKLHAVAVDYYTVNELGDHLEWNESEDKPIACGIMFRKDRLFDIGLYDESFRAREEEDLRIRFNEKFSIYHIPLPLYRYRRHDNNLTNNTTVMDQYKDVLNEKHRK